MNCVQTAPLFTFQLTCRRMIFWKTLNLDTLKLVVRQRKMQLTDLGEKMLTKNYGLEV